MHWRCLITPVFNISSRHGALIAEGKHSDELVAHYSSASRGGYFGWRGVARARPSTLADRFVEHFPQIVEAGRGPDWDYAGWYQWMLHLTEPDMFPIAYADYDLATDYLDTVCGREDIRIPLPPPGLAKGK
jgi:hypothetical protein